MVPFICGIRSCSFIASTLFSIIFLGPNSKSAWDPKKTALKARCHSGYRTERRMNLNSTVETSTARYGNRPKHSIPPTMALAAARCLVESRLLAHGIAVYRPCSKGMPCVLIAEINGLFLEIRIELVGEPRGLRSEHFQSPPDVKALVSLETGKVEWLPTEKHTALPPTLRDMNVLTGKERSPLQHTA